jgi:hypothetical protein
MLGPVLLHFGGSRDVVINMGEPQGISSGIPLEVSGCVWLSTAGMAWLGNWRTGRPLVTRDIEFTGTVVLPLTDEQLAVIDKKSAGREIRILLDTDVVLYDPTMPDDFQTSLTYGPSGRFRRASRSSTRPGSGCLRRPHWPRRWLLLSRCRGTPAQLRGLALICETTFARSTTASTRMPLLQLDELSMTWLQGRNQRSLPWTPTRGSAACVSDSRFCGKQRTRRQVLLRTATR